MDPILSIIKYIFHQYDKENHDDTLNSFFDNGISFPAFISLIFEIDGISGIIENPENVHDKESNNNIALKFLYQNSKIILENEKNDLNTEENRKKLILDIITKQYFKISQELIIEKSNLILQPTKNKTLNIINIMKPIFLLSLLFVLTDGITENPNSIKSNENIYSCLQANFEKAKVPYFLDQFSFDISNEDIYLIQIQIIFNVFNVKIFSEGKISRNPSEASEENIESTSEKEIKKIKRKKEIENEDKFILKLINVLGINGGFKFEDFLHLIQNDNLPRYVMYYLQISSIENVFLSDIKSDKITRKIIKNINAVIEFMKTKEKKFEILLFNFKNPLMRENSTKLFFRHFLNTFFLKVSRKKLYERCATLLCRKFEFKDDVRFSDLNNLGHFLGLLHFITEGNLNFDYRKLSFFDEQSVKQLFKKAKVPRLINKEVLKNFNSFEISQDLVFYQLQFIFNKLDSAPASRRIIEAFLKGYQLLKNVQVPDKDVLAASIEAKRKFIEYQKKHKNEEEEIDQLTNENLNNNENDNNNPISNDDEDDDESQTETDEEKDKNDTDKYIDPEIFWNPPDTNIGLDNGILFNSSEEFQEIVDEENFEDHPDDFALLENAFSIDENWVKENKTNLYKIFYYDEKLNEWKFDEKVFKEIEKNEYNDKNPEVPIVFYLNSNEKDLIKVNSSFIKGVFPILDDEQIYVYALYGGLFHYSSKDDDKNSTKPLFLVLHVPKEKESLPNIRTIVFQITNFIALLCDVKIVVFDKQKHMKDQLLFITDINEITRNQIGNEYIIKTLMNDKIKNAKRSRSSDESDSDIVIQEDDFEEEEDDFEFYYKNLEEESSADQNKFQGLKIIYLIYDRTIKLVDVYNSIIDENHEDDQYFYQFSSITFEEFRHHYIDVNDSSTFSYFRKTLSDFIKKDDSVSYLSDTKKRFSCINTSEFSGLYLKLRLNSISFLTELHNVINRRFDMIKANLKTKKSDYLLSLNILLKEIISFTPDLDIDFRNECNSIISSLAESFAKKNQKILIHELKKSSSSHLKELIEQINKKHFWSEEQIDLIIRSHITFLEEEFNRIIQSKYNDSIYDIIYEHNISILNDQINEDKEKLRIEFKPFFEYIKIKQNVVPQDFKVSGLKKTNYILKEKEVNREIKISIEVGKLESEIESDY